MQIYLKTSRALLADCAQSTAAGLKIHCNAREETSIPSERPSSTEDA